MANSGEYAGAAESLRSGECPTVEELCDRCVKVQWLSSWAQVNGVRASIALAEILAKADAARRHAAATRACLGRLADDPSEGAPGADRFAATRQIA